MRFSCRRESCKVWNSAPSASILRMSMAWPKRRISASSVVYSTRTRRATRSQRGGKQLTVTSDAYDAFESQNGWRVTLRRAASSEETRNSEMSQTCTSQSGRAALIPRSNAISAHEPIE